MDATDYKTFTLGDHITKEQKNSFERFGFIHFKNVLTQEQVQEIIKSSEEIQEKWIREGIDKVNGIPIKYGEDENGKKIVHRFVFTSQFSEAVHQFVNSDKMKSIRSLLSPEARIAENEKDGVVLNHYINTEKSNFRQMGWHTDSMRDIFYGKKILPMLNVGLYLDDSSEVNGCLRVLPGTHKQNIFNMFFKKTYFINNKEDKNEVLVRTNAGDVVVHDGRIWHRVGLSPHIGSISRRRVMYTPVLIGSYQPKNSDSATPLYHHLQKMVK